MLQVTTVAQAVQAASCGIDVIIAQGGEAGGYCGDVSTMALVPQVVALRFLSWQLEAYLTDVALQQH